MLEIALRDSFLEVSNGHNGVTTQFFALELRELRLEIEARLERVLLLRELDGLRHHDLTCSSSPGTRLKSNYSTAKEICSMLK